MFELNLFPSKILVKHSAICGRVLHVKDGHLNFITEDPSSVLSSQLNYRRPKFSTVLKIDLKHFKYLFTISSVAVEELHIRKLFSSQYKKAMTVMSISEFFRTP
jgi:hypothetical protein